jgi:hypothetical protein
VTQGTTPATVTVHGINFVRRSVVHFKGKPVPTQVVSRRRSGSRWTPRRSEHPDGSSSLL